MNAKLLGGILVLCMFSTLVLASNAPPTIPTEYWGRALIDGDEAPPGTPVTSDYGSDTVDSNGYYDVILTGGDSPLTFLDDPTCVAHWPDEACITCSTDPLNETYCIEGPQDGDEVTVNLDGNPISVVWGSDASVEEHIMTLYRLFSGWNMISMAVERDDLSIQNYMDELTGQRVAFHYDAEDVADHWKGYDSTTPPFTWDLLTLEPKKGYWLKVDNNQNMSFIGKRVQDTTINLIEGWNMIGFLLYTDTIENAMVGLTGQRVAFHYAAEDVADHWKGYDSTTPPFTWDLINIEVGRGYWLKVDSNQTWEGT